MIATATLTNGPMTGRRQRLETLRDRFVAISMRSRTLRLVRPSRTGALDLQRLGAGPSLLWLVKVLGSDEARPGVLADVASGEGADPLSLDVAALAHAARAEQMETGADDLAIGWPFLEGRAADGTWLRAPLLLYPVTLGQTHKGRLRWTLEPAGPPLFNEPLLQTLSRLAGVRLGPEDFLARDDDGRFRIDDATWRGLVETLLAVAITRARLGLWLFASFDPEQLGVGQTKNVGPKLLEAYLRYARAIGRGDERDAEACLAEAAELGGGRGVTARDGRLDRVGRTGLAVRDAVAKALEERGYRVKRDVGLGRLSLDLAVCGFDDAVFRVGVDCSAFLAEADAFTRDVYVPLFWQRLGWTLLRVTPGLWLEDRRAVLTAIDRAVDAAST